jgi:large subunit ribosomal protein L15
MSSLQNLTSDKKKRKRVGRGNASGHGTFSCRGMNGQSSRAGGRRRPGFEGGQTSYIRRMPKIKGFTNINNIEYQVINVGDLNIFDDNSTVNLEALYAKNLISKKNKPVKLLGGKGELEKQLTVMVHKVSSSATMKIEAKNGKVELIEKIEKTEQPKSK